VTVSRRRRARGFTLVEILVALVVLGVVGGALLELFQGGLRNVAASDDYTRAALLARSMLAQLEARDRFVAPLEEGRFDERFWWRLQAAPYVGPDGAPLPGYAPLPGRRTNRRRRWRCFGSAGARLRSGLFVQQSPILRYASGG
jgi:general secretion pathway protein I